MTSAFGAGLAGPDSGSGPGPGGGPPAFAFSAALTVAEPTEAACPGRISFMTVPPPAVGTVTFSVPLPSNMTNITPPEASRLAMKVVPETAPVTPPQSTTAPPFPGGVFTRTLP